MSIWQEIIDMLTAPFAGPLDLTHLFLLVGVVLIFVAVWVLILNHVRMAAEEI
jgi:hypothetical protein